MVLGVRAYASGRNGHRKVEAMAQLAVPIDSMPSRYAPKYVDLAQKLLRHIADADLQPGDLLGTENEMGRVHGVSRVTVRQALACLERDGYVTRRKARGTFVKRSVSESRQAAIERGTVVVVCSNEQAANADEDFAFATVLRAIERGLSSKGIAVQILGIGENEQADRIRLRQIAQRHDVRGFCTIGASLDAYTDLVPNIPIVTSCHFYSSGLPFVGQDVTAVCRDSIEYLLARGHERIAVVCGPWVDRKAFGFFVEAYRETFAAAGLPCLRNLLYHAYPGESLDTLAEEALEGPIRPTAVFAENWRVCEAVLGAATRQGHRVPDDLSIVAYGQNVLHMASPVPITTYVPDSEGIGQRAAELVTALVEGGNVPAEPVLVPGRLIERGSVRSLNSLG